MSDQVQTIATAALEAALALAAAEDRPIACVVIVAEGDDSAVAIEDLGSCCQFHTLSRAAQLANKAVAATASAGLQIASDHARRN